MTLMPYQSVPIKDNGEPLVDLSKFDFELEPVYHKAGLTSDTKMYLRQGLVKRLTDIQAKLNGYHFKIWDGYRSRAVQNKIYEDEWQKVKQEHPDWPKEQIESEVGTFVTVATDPDRIPPHASGGAVDLTLVDINGKEVDMGTIFDHFGPEASPLYFEENNIDTKIRDNRRFLREAMEKADFRSDANEWWHFDYGNQSWAYVLKKPYAIYGEVKGQS